MRSCDAGASAGTRTVEDEERVVITGLTEIEGLITEGNVVNSLKSESGILIDWKISIEQSSFRLKRPVAQRAEKRRLRVEGELNKTQPCDFGFQ